MAEPVELVWELETPASIEATWALFGDTDRYNRAAGFDFDFEEETRPDGTVRRIGHAKALGVVDLRWEERPFRYRVPEWFESTRLFDGGPGERLVTSLRLEDLGGRTGIRYTIAVTPRNFFARALVAIELKTVTRPKVDAIIRVMLARLSGEDAAYDPLPEPLSGAAEERVLAIVPRVPPPTGERIATFLREAPLFDQATIHPLRLDWGIPEDRLLDGVLSAVREGLLDLRWDLLCPKCRGAKASPSSLAELPDAVHCPSCNISYDGTFPDSIVVSLRPAEAVRSLDVTVACIGSPLRQPHVLAQDNLGPSGSTELALDLPVGAYRIRTAKGRGAVSLIVREGVPSENATLRIQREKLQPSRILVPPGAFTLSVDNYAGQPVDVLVEDRSMPDGVLTMGRLLERPRAKELLPPESLMPGLEVVTRQGAVLAAEALDDDLEWAAEQVREAQPRSMSLSPRGLVAVWTDFQSAIDAAAVLAREADIQLALNSGAVTEVTMGSKTIPMGSAVERALGALVGAAEHHAALPVDRADAPEVRAALDVHRELIKVDFALSSGVRVHWIQFKS